MLSIPCFGENVIYLFIQLSHHYLTNQNTSLYLLEFVDQSEYFFKIV